jgi:RHS repeat-associated protein
MRCEATSEPGRWRTVGDPIDVVTGANAYFNRDFLLTGPLLFQWRRYYDSSRNRHLGALGWGHTHEYDCSLRFDLDGVRYVEPSLASVGFPALLRDGAQAASRGRVLRRVSSRVFQVRHFGQPLREFTFTGGSVARLTRVVHGIWSIRLEYGADGHLALITDARDRRIRVDHDSKGRVQGLVLLGPTPAQNRTLFLGRYDERGNLVEGVDPYKNSFRFRYDADNRMVCKTDQLGYSFFFEYHSQGRCVHSRGEDGQYEVRLRYLTDERVTVVKRGDGGQWMYFYNEGGQVTKVIDPYGGVRTFQLNGHGQLLEEADPNGAVTRVLYEAFGAPVFKVSPQGRLLPVSAPPVGPPPPDYQVGYTALAWEWGRLIDGPGITPPESSDARAFSKLPPFAFVLVQTRPPATEAGAPEPGRNGKAWPPASPRVYDDFGLLVREVGPAGRPRAWTYDAGGNVHRYHDHDGGATTQEFTSWGLLARQTNPNGHALAFTYNASRLLTSVTDAGGAKSEYAYDLKDRLYRVYRHGVLKEEYLYDQADNLIEKRDGNGNPLLTFEIGSRNLKAVRRLASGETHAFAYDERCRCVRAATNSAETLFAYDDAGRRILDERDGLGVVHWFGRRGLGRTTALGKFVTRYERPSRDTLLIHDPSGQTQAMTFPGHGLVIKTLSNIWMEVSQYDAAGRCLLKAAARRETSDQPWFRTFGYSGEGDLLRALDSERGTFQYQYDPGHRLTAAVLPGGKVQEFAYDHADNLIRQPGLADVRLIEGNRLETANGETFTYNDRNNIALRQRPGGTVWYTYDSRDMLVGCEAGALHWRAEYDPLGRRTRKAWVDRRVDFYWDCDRLAAEVHQDGRVRVYVYPDELALVPLLFLEYDSLEADPASGKRFFLFCDQIGTPVRVKDDAGTNVWGARIDPYGKAHVDWRARIEVPLRFPGHYYDAELNLHYNRFRYYSPDLGRYLQSDPWGMVGGANLYAYPASPLSHVDVLGACKNKVQLPEDMTDREAVMKALMAPGEIDVEGKTPDQIRAELAALAKQRAADVMANLSNNERSANLTARVDTETGKVYFALNDKVAPDDLHPTVAQQRTDAMDNPTPEAAAAKYNDNTVHGEQQTASDMLNDRPDSNPTTDSQVGNVALRGSDKGKFRNMCGMCQQIHDGTDTVPGEIDPTNRAGAAPPAGGGGPAPGGGGGGDAGGGSSPASGSGGSDNESG